MPYPCGDEPWANDPNWTRNQQMRRRMAPNEEQVFNNLLACYLKAARKKDKEKSREYWRDQYRGASK